MLYFPKNAGTAGGLMGGLVYVITSITSFIISVSGTVTDQKDLSWRYLIISFLLLGIILILHQAVKKENHRYSVFGDLWQMQGALFKPQTRKNVGQSNHCQQAEEKTVDTYFSE